MADIQFFDILLHCAVPGIVEQFILMFVVQKRLFSEWGILIHLIKQLENNNSRNAS